MNFVQQAEDSQELFSNWLTWPLFQVHLRCRHQCHMLMFGCMLSVNLLGLESVTHDIVGADVEQCASRDLFCLKATILSLGVNQYP